LLATIVTPIATGLVMFMVVTADPAPVSGAGTLTVTNCHDSGAGSLRADIASAAAGDTVNFFVSCPATSPITLASTLDITTNLNISGPGTTRLVVSGNNAVEDFSVASGVTATISGITIEKGLGGTTGGVSYGGGINNEGTLTVAESTLSANSSDYIGGGIENDNGSLVVTDSTLAGNSAAVGGGGIWNNGTVTITDSTLSGNSTPNNGGGIDNGGTMAITGSTLSDNSAGGTQYGGGIENDNGTLTLTISTMYGNSAGAGGAIFNLYDAGIVAMVASTLSNNGGSAIYNIQGTVNAKATIVANSTPSGGCEGDGTFTDLGYNLNDDGTCQFTTGTSLPDTPSGLDPAGLQNNGGPTQTIALEPGSAAIKHITNAAFCLPTDQRGYVVTVPCDIGAYDTSAIPPGGLRPPPSGGVPPPPPPPVLKQPPPSRYEH
jgi:hypothetical protein